MKKRVYGVAHRFPRGTVWHIDERFFTLDKREAEDLAQEWWGVGGYNHSWRIVAFDATDLGGKCFECGEKDCTKSCRCEACKEYRRK